MHTITTTTRGSDLKQGSDVHVEAQVGEARGDDLGPPVVSVLAHLGHQQTGVPALVVLKLHHSAGVRGQT